MRTFPLLLTAMPPCNTISPGQNDASGPYRNTMPLVNKITPRPGLPPPTRRSLAAAAQVWDSVQALCSYIRSSFTTKALLQGIGVGDRAATALGATSQFFARDLAGRCASIAFALAQGGRLDASAKQWRMFADCLNNVAYLLELAAPVFPAAFLPLVCAASVGHALVGVAGGATRAALTHHFALANNAADVAAKEGSQETVTTLVGMLLGLAMLRAADGRAGATWALFLVLTALHVYANARAVRSLRLASLNRDRAALLLREYAASGRVLTQAEAAVREPLLPFSLNPGRWRRGAAGRVELGGGLEIGRAHV